MGVWIETVNLRYFVFPKEVTPCVGVWIETIERRKLYGGIRSHPAWVCGLKLWLNFYLVNFHNVTPCVGVWIETGNKDFTTSICLSHPAWVCGLKPQPSCPAQFQKRHTLRGCVDWNRNASKCSERTTEVTPCVGVWIETFPNCITLQSCVSHTLRGCVDWNYVSAMFAGFFLKSHPAWVCGLKPTNGKIPRRQNVTPCVGVWIETSLSNGNTSFAKSHPAWVCGLKPLRFGENWQSIWSHPAWVCGLKPFVARFFRTYYTSHPAWVCGLKHRYQMGIQVLQSHTLRGCVDWNKCYVNICVAGLVTPCVGVWIETTGFNALATSGKSHPAWVCGLKPCFTFFCKS